MERDKEKLLTHIEAQSINALISYRNKIAALTMLDLTPEEVEKLTNWKGR